MLSFGTVAPPPILIAQKYLSLALLIWNQNTCLWLGRGSECLGLHPPTKERLSQVKLKRKVCFQSSEKTSNTALTRNKPSGHPSWWPQRTFEIRYVVIYVPRKTIVRHGRLPQRLCGPQPSFHPPLRARSRPSR